MPAKNKLPDDVPAFAVPNTCALPGREREFETIIDFVHRHTVGTDSTILFVSGACGSGKTSTIARAEAYLKSLPTNDRQFKAQSISKEYDISLNSPDTNRFTSPVNLRWKYINCSGLTMTAMMDAIWESLAKDEAFATTLLTFIKEMFLVRGSENWGGKSIKLSDKKVSASSAGGLSEGDASFFKKYEVVRPNARKDKNKPFFVFALDEAEFADSSCYPLLSAFTSCATEHSSRMCLLLISNAKGLPFLPLSVNGKKSVTELVFESYSIDSLRRAVRAHFEEKFQLEDRLSSDKSNVKKRQSRTKAESGTASLTLDDVLHPAALDYAVKTAVNAHSADLRKAIALCGNAIGVAQDKQRHLAVQQPQEIMKANATKVGGKRGRSGVIAQEPISSSSGVQSSEAAKLPTTVQPKVTLQTLISTVADAQSSLDQIQTLPPYMRQLLKCFVECVKKHSTYSFLPRRLQEELYKKTEELRIPSISSASVIEGLEELRSLGFVTTSSSSTRSQKEYTLSWPLAELETKLAALQGFL